MIRTRSFTLTTALILTMPTLAAAQETTMSVRPESRVTLAGSSTVRDWSCRTSGFEATISAAPGSEAATPAGVAKPIVKVAVTIPVRSLKCGNKKMERDMYRALNANQFPTISYVLESYTIDADRSSADVVAALSVGEITVAGKTQRVEIPMTAQRKANGTVLGEGTAKLLMTDFGIKPPTALLGLLRTRNEIAISFNVLLDKTAVVAVTQP